MQVALQTHSVVFIKKNSYHFAYMLLEELWILKLKNVLG